MLSELASGSVLALSSYSLTAKLERVGSASYSFHIVIHVQKSSVGNGNIFSISRFRFFFKCIGYLRLIVQKLSEILMRPFASGQECADLRFLVSIHVRSYQCFFETCFS